MTKQKFEQQDGVVIGNVEDKANLNNPIARWFVDGFDSKLFELIEKSSPASIHEVGCGEGRLTSAISNKYKVPIRGTDLGSAIIGRLRDVSLSNYIQYEERSVYDLNQNEDSADLLICCEVLEHLGAPEKALNVLRQLGARQYIFSVPREPVWCLLNIARGKYLSSFGNTPGHLNHWSKKGFVDLLERSGFFVKELSSPIPWTMALCQLEKETG